MTFALTVLGTSSALPTSERYPSAHVLNVHEHFYLIDCGEGTQLQLRKNKIKLSKLHNIFISHTHGDHVFGLPGLLSSLNLLGRKSPLNIYSHTELELFIDFYLQHFGQELEYEINFHPLKSKRPEIIFENKHITVESIPLKHRIPTVGFVFREKTRPKNIKKEAIEKLNLSIKDIHKIKNGQDFVNHDGTIIPNHELTLPPYKTRSYAYISDTKYSEKILPFLQQVDLLYHEATFSEQDKDLAKITYHSTSAQAATIAQKANVSKLIIGHFSARYKNIAPLVEEAKLIFPNSEAGEDGKTYQLKQIRVNI